MFRLQNILVGLQLDYENRDCHSEMDAMLVAQGWRPWLLGPYVFSFWWEGNRVFICMKDGWLLLEKSIKRSFLSESLNICRRVCVSVRRQRVWTCFLLSSCLSFQSALPWSILIPVPNYSSTLLLNPPQQQHGAWIAWGQQWE